MTNGSDFGCSLYRALPGGDLFFSPLSVELALALATVGARGNTRKQLVEVLGLSSLSDEMIVRWVQGEVATAGTEGVTLEIANRIYAQEGYNFLPAFMSLMESLAGIEIVDFAKNFEAVREEINRWVEGTTHQKIQNLLGPGSLDTLTRMVIANAVYFKGNWASKFDKNLTQEDDFHVTPRKTVKVPMMYQSGEFNYFSNGHVQFLALPYRDPRIEMIIILPREGIVLERVEGDALGDLTSAVRDMRAKEVHVYLPRFEISWGTQDLTDALKRMGIVDAFCLGAADFTGMEPSRELFIGGVFHKAYVRVDEEGSEAAAATAVVMTREAFIIREPIIFRADRPFMFLIVAGQSVLFMGRLVDPTQ